MADFVEETFITTESPADLGKILVIVVIIVSLYKYMFELNHCMCYFCLKPAVILVLVVNVGGAQLFPTPGQLQPGHHSPVG